MPKIPTPKADDIEVIDDHVDKLPTIDEPEADEIEVRKIVKKTRD